MAGMLPMMRNFVRDWRSYRSELAEQDRWIQAYATKKGYSVNPRWMVYTNLKLWLADSLAMYGRRYCPCFEPTGDKQADNKLVCPCSYLEAELEERGWCHCTLFGRADLTAADFKRAESELMAEYRDTPLVWVENVLDTRGQHIDGLRGLPVPDAIHQVKRALGGHGVPLDVLVATQVEAAHLERLAQLRGLGCAVSERAEGGPYHVSLR